MKKYMYVNQIDSRRGVTPAGCEAREAEGTGAAEQMLHGRATARTLSLTID